MTKLKFLAAAAVLTSLAATPVLAKDAPDHAGKKTMKVHKAGKQARMQQRDARTAAFGNDRRYDNGGLFPGAVVGGIVGGAVNTAGAIATAPFRDDYAYDPAYDDSYRYARRPYREYDGFAPVDAAANIVDDAVTTAGAIATAPFRNTYASAPVYRSNSWNNGWNDGYNTSWNNGWAGQSYAQRNGFVCTPGTMFTNENGRTQICQ